MMQSWYARRETVAALIETMRLGDLLGVLDGIATRSRQRLDLYDVAMGAVPLDRRSARELDSWEALCLRRLHIHDSVDLLYARIDERTRLFGSTTRVPRELQQAVMTLLDETVRVDETDGWLMQGAITAGATNHTA